MPKSLLYTLCFILSVNILLINAGRGLPSFSKSSSKYSPTYSFDSQSNRFHRTYRDNPSSDYQYSPRVYPLESSRDYIRGARPLPESFSKSYKYPPPPNRPPPPPPSTRSKRQSIGSRNHQSAIVIHSGFTNTAPHRPLPDHIERIMSQTVAQDYGSSSRYLATSLNDQGQTLNVQRKPVDYKRSDQERLQLKKPKSTPENLGPGGRSELKSSSANVRQTLHSSSPPRRPVPEPPSSYSSLGQINRRKPPPPPPPPVIISQSVSSSEKPPRRLPPIAPPSAQTPPFNFNPPPPPPPPTSANFLTLSRNASNTLATPAVKPAAPSDLLTQIRNSGGVKALKTAPAGRNSQKLRIAKASTNAGASSLIVGADNSPSPQNSKISVVEELEARERRRRRIVEKKSAAVRPPPPPPPALPPPSSSGITNSKIENGIGVVKTPLLPPSLPPRSNNHDYDRWAIPVMRPTPPTAAPTPPLPPRNSPKVAVADFSKIPGAWPEQADHAPSVLSKSSSAAGPPPPPPPPPPLSKSQSQSSAIPSSKPSRSSPILSISNDDNRSQLLSAIRSAGGVTALKPAVVIKDHPEPAFPSKSQSGKDGPADLMAALKHSLTSRFSALHDSDSENEGDTSDADEWN